MLSFRHSPASRACERLLKPQFRHGKRFNSPESCPTPSSIKRFNPLGIQMLSKPFYEHLFKHAGASGPDKKTVCLSIEHLKKQNLWAKEVDDLPDTIMDLPPIQGSNLDEHFRTIAKTRSQPYLDLAVQLAGAKLCPMPVKWSSEPGWTRYDASTGREERVEVPCDDALVFDVESCVPEGQRPILAVAVSPKAWYSWTNRRLASSEDFCGDIERDTVLDDLIPLERSGGGGGGESLSAADVKTDALDENVVVGTLDGVASQRNSDSKTEQDLEESPIVNGGKSGIVSATAHAQELAPEAPASRGIVSATAHAQELAPEAPASRNDVDSPTPGQLAAELQPLHDDRVPLEDSGGSVGLPLPEGGGSRDVESHDQLKRGGDSESHDQQHVESHDQLRKQTSEGKDNLLEPLSDRAQPSVDPQPLGDERVRSLSLPLQSEVLKQISEGSDSVEPLESHDQLLKQISEGSDSVEPLLDQGGESRDHLLKQISEGSDSVELREQLLKQISEGSDSLEPLLDQNSQLRGEHESPLETSEWLVVEAVTQPEEPEASKFANIDIDEIEEAWNDHVTKLSQHMSARVAVSTHFLFGRLFGLVRSQFCNLTREACNYLGEDHKAIAAHFLVTTELLRTQFQLPKVYIDAEMVKSVNILEQHVFLVLELQDTLTTYMDKRRIVLKALSDFKLALRQQSGDSTAKGALGLCRAVHKFHFQLLVLLGSYVKLISILEKPMETSPMLDVRGELTDLIRECSEAVVFLSRGSSPSVDDHSYSEVEQLHSLADAIGSLEDTLGQRQHLKAVQLLHTMRKQWKGEELLGTTEEDDVDCLFFIYSHYIADRQGMLCVTKTEHSLSEVHARLMGQNISLHSLLEQAQALSHDSDTPPTKRKHFQIQEPPHT